MLRAKPSFSGVMCFAPLFKPGLHGFPLSLNTPRGKAFDEVLAEKMPANHRHHAVNAVQGITNTPSGVLLQNSVLPTKTAIKAGSGFRADGFMISFLRFIKFLVLLPGVDDRVNVHFVALNKI